MTKREGDNSEKLDEKWCLHKQWDDQYFYTPHVHAARTLTPTEKGWSCNTTHSARNDSAMSYHSIEECLKSIPRIRSTKDCHTKNLVTNNKKPTKKPGRKETSKTVHITILFKPIPFDAKIKFGKMFLEFLSYRLLLTAIIFCTSLKRSSPSAWWSSLIRCKFLTETRNSNPKACKNHKLRSPQVLCPERI